MEFKLNKKNIILVHFHISALLIKSKLYIQAFINIGLLNLLKAILISFWKFFSLIFRFVSISDNRGKLYTGIFSKNYIRSNSSNKTFVIKNPNSLGVFKLNNSNNPFLVIPIFPMPNAIKFGNVALVRYSIPLSPISFSATSRICSSSNVLLTILTRLLHVNQFPFRLNILSFLKGVLKNFSNETSEIRLLLNVAS